MLFKKGDIVVTDREGMEGISMVVTDLSNELRVCECEYWYGNETLFTEEFRFDELTVIVEAEV
jgi:uncharacterized protein YodC (DUF2158 family)